MIALRMRRQIETSSGFIVDCSDFGLPRSQRGAREISLEGFFRNDVIDGHSLLNCPAVNTPVVRDPGHFLA